MYLRKIHILSSTLEEGLIEQVKLEKADKLKTTHGEKQSKFNCGRTIWNKTWRV